MALRRIKLTLTTDGSGVGTVEFTAKGELIGYLYDPGDHAVGTDLTIKDYTSGLVLAKMTDMGGVTYAARLVAASGTFSNGMGLANANAANTALTIAAGTPAFSSSAPIVCGRTQVVIGQGGANHTGYITFFVRTL